MFLRSVGAPFSLREVALGPELPPAVFWMPIIAIMLRHVTRSARGSSYLLADSVC